ncbi:MAG: hypothetical protein U9R06_01440 [Patescibacteria group bacterium]|nr:hypothetical protein [Patescibacteria group bacterium]
MKKIIIILLIIGAAIIFWRLFIGSRPDAEETAKPAAAKPAEPAKYNEPINYSRVTFFHAMPLKCSLAVPEDWEGKYRVKTAGNKAIFYYVANPSAQVELFFIKTYLADAESAANEEKILAKNDTYYTYSLSTVNEEAIVNQKDFIAMQYQSQELAKTLKCFSLD